MPLLIFSIAAVITAGLIIAGNMTDTIELRCLAWIAAYFVGTRGLQWSIEARQQR